MSEDPALRGFLRECEEARWLEPDTEIDALGPAASRLFDECADEHAAALSQWLDPSEEPLALRPWVTRTSRGAATAWRAAWDPDGELRDAPSDPRGVRAFERTAPKLAGVDERWARALRAQQASLLERMVARREASGPWASGDPLVELVEAPLRTAAHGSRMWAHAPNHPDEFRRGPYRAALEHARCLADGDPRPSPWAPLFALWHRGVWPFALTGGRLGLFVPRAVGVRDGAPKPPSWTHVAPVPYTESGHDPLNDLLGFGFPAKVTQPARRFVMRGPLAPPELPDGV